MNRDTSTAVRSGKGLADRSADYRRGYVAGMRDVAPLNVILGSMAILAVTFICVMGIAGARADRAEAQLAEMRAGGFTVLAPTSARDGDVIMLRWDSGAWRPMIVTTPIIGQNLHYGWTTP